MLHDVRYALRTVRQNPGFALVAVLSLALGIGANAAMFSFADGLILRPLPVPHSSAVLDVNSLMREERVAQFNVYSGMSYPDYKDLRDRSQSFGGLNATSFSSFGFAQQKGALPEMRFGEMVSGNFFRVMQVQPFLGRDFRPEEDQAPGRDAVAILGYDMWKNDLGSSREVVGRTIFLNGIGFTVVGVAPASFTGSNNFVHTALYVPLSMARALGNDGKDNTLDSRDQRFLTVRGRLKPGVSVAQAASETAVIAQQLAQAYPASNRTCSLVVATYEQSQFQRSVGNAILVVFLMILSGLVLLIACGNVMNLMLSRARARSREIAVRLAIGASRGRLIRQFLIESLVIALAGGATGLLVAQAGADLFSQIRIPSAIPIVIEVKLDLRVLLFTLGAALVSAILFGLVPALQASKPELTPALKSGKADAGKRSRLFGRNALVIGQVAVSLVLLVLAAQAYRGAAILLSGSIGFRTDHLLLASFNPTLARYTRAQSEEFYRKLLDNAGRLAGVQTAALATDVPMGVTGGDARRVVPEGFQLAAGAEAAFVPSVTVSERYFDAMGIPIVEGRAFQTSDRADSTKVAIVNELFARRFFPRQSAVGRRFRFNNANGEAIEIVGVAKQSKYTFPVEPSFEYLYLPLSQNPATTGMTLMLHTPGPPAEMSGPLRQMVSKLDANQPVFGVITMEEYFDQRATKLIGTLNQAIGGMGVLGLVLALVGLYGLMTYSVGLRQREIGIRMAIGADQRGVLWMVLRQGMRLAGAGIAIGLVLTLMASRGISNFLGTQGFHLPLMTLVTLALAAVAGMGAYIPARRASKVDPIGILRQE